MKKDLKLVLVQPDIIWQDISGNLAKFEQMLSAVDRTDLIIFPEMFATGFIADPEPFRNQQDKVLTYMQTLSGKKKAVVMGSHPWYENGTYSNRLIACRPDGEMAFYDKRHLFAYGNENIRYRPGKKRMLLEVNEWKLLPLICYDLRFPVWSRNTDGYRLLIYVANWPSARNEVWNTLLKARAIENQCYVAGINRTGTDGSGIHYSGGSMLIAPGGEILGSMKDEEGILQHSLSRQALADFRRKYPFLDDRDSFTFLL